MTEEEIIINNKLIAEFIHSKTDGMFIWDNPPELIANNSKWIGYTEYSAKFHSSWDWLMPCIEKIESHLFVTSIQYGQKNYYVEIYEHPQLPNTIGKFNPIIEIGKTNKLNVVYETIIEFIKWYNKHKQNE